MYFRAFLQWEVTNFELLVEFSNSLPFYLLVSPLQGGGMDTT